ncbi:hypothetical protein D3C80_1110310 [compost metagenome]
MKKIIVDKSKLVMIEDCVCLKDKTFNKVNKHCQSIDKVIEGDAFDSLLVDKNMLTMMNDVWYDKRESFTITMKEHTIKVK